MQPAFLLVVRAAGPLMGDIRPFRFLTIQSPRFASGCGGIDVHTNDSAHVGSKSGVSVV